MFLLVFGAVFAWTGMLAAPEDFDDPVTTTGVVVGVESGYDSDGVPVYRPVVEYESGEGQTRTVVGQVGSGSVPRVGATREVTDSRPRPSEAKLSDGLDAGFYLVFLGMGVLIFLSGVWTVGVSAAMAVLGVKLWRSGRADRRSVGADSTGLFSDLFRLARQPDVLASVAPPVIGSHVAVVPPAGMPGVSTPPPSEGPQSSEGAPAVVAGWYPDAAHPGWMRVHDGVASTDHRTPAP